MSIAIELTSLVCALGAVVFVTVAGATGRSLLLAGGTCAVALAWPLLAAAPATSGLTGLVAAGIAIAKLSGWGRVELHALAAGWLAGSWASLLHAGGMPLWGGAALAVALPAVAVVYSNRRPDFAPDVLREDALIAIALVALCAAAAPALAEGWRAALNLKFDGAEQAATAVPMWALAVSVGATAAGAGYAAWSRR